MQDNYGKISDRYVRYSDEKQGLEYLHNNPDVASVINLGLELFDLPADKGNETEEADFRRRMQMQQKKKKRRGIRM